MFLECFRFHLKPFNKVLSLGNKKKNKLFLCISLAYSYLCARDLCFRESALYNI